MQISITFDETLISVENVQIAIEKPGYKAIEEDTTVDTDKEKKEK
ncbi:hypothetical protein [Clostridium bowmanii]|nr:hypothetical protein [Clostridium bowmanii]